MTDALEQLITRTFCSIENNNDSIIKYESEELMSELWDDFKNIITSITGKYHPKICNIRPYGLVNHTIRVIHFAEEQCISYNLSQNKREKIMMACLFHDIGKIPYQHGISSFINHGKWGYDWLKERNVDKDVCVMVRDHMAHWEDVNTWSNAKHISKDWSKLTPILAYSDYLASRKNIILSHEKFMILKHNKTKMITELRFIFDKSMYWRCSYLMGYILIKEKIRSLLLRNYK